MHSSVFPIQRFHKFSLSLSSWLKAWKLLKSFQENLTRTNSLYEGRYHDLKDFD